MFISYYNKELLFCKGYFNIILSRLGVVFLTLISGLKLEKCKNRSTYLAYCTLCSICMVQKMVIGANIDVVVVQFKGLVKDSRLILHLISIDRQMICEYNMVYWKFFIHNGALYLMIWAKAWVAANALQLFTKHECLQVVASCGKLWQVVASCGKLLAKCWQVVTNCGKLWQVTGKLYTSCKLRVVARPCNTE